MRKLNYKITTSRDIDTTIVNTGNSTIEIVDQSKEEKYNLYFDYTFGNYIKAIKKAGYLNNSFDYKQFSMLLDSILRESIIEYDIELERVAHTIYRKIIFCNGFLDYEDTLQIISDFKEKFMEE